MVVRLDNHFQADFSKISQTGSMIHPCIATCRITHNHKANTTLVFLRCNLKSCSIAIGILRQNVIWELSDLLLSILVQCGHPILLKTSTKLK